MANLKSAIKRIKQNEKRRKHNRIFAGQARTYVRKARTALEGSDDLVSEESVRQAVSALDKAAKKGVIHKNNAARRKSRLMKRLAAQQKKSAQ